MHTNKSCYRQFYQLSTLSIKPLFPQDKSSFLAIGCQKVNMIFGLEVIVIPLFLLF